MSAHLAHRAAGYALLNGSGIEIGAFHQPAQLPKDCQVKYCDVCTPEEAIKLFPELDIKSLVKVDYIADLDQDGLSIFADNSQDFIVINHVIEHVANPIRVISELFRVVRPQGKIVLSAPDKRFCFDKNRALTSFVHLREEFENNVTTATDEHYWDFLRNVHPKFFEQDPANLPVLLEKVKKRREHVHVWDSESFQRFTQKTLDYLYIRAKRLFVSIGDDNQFELFSVWEKE